MIKGVIACDVCDVHAQSFLIEMVDVAKLDVASQRCGTLVVEVYTQFAAVVFEIQLIVFIGSLNLSWVDRERGGNVAVVHLQSQGVVCLGVEIILRIDIIHRSLGVDIVSRLVA